MTAQRHDDASAIKRILHSCSEGIDWAPFSSVVDLFADSSWKDQGGAGEPSAAAPHR